MLCQESFLREGVLQWREYKDQPDLLEVYLPSAERMLEMVSQAVDAMIEGVLT